MRVGAARTEVAAEERDAVGSDEEEAEVDSQTWREDGMFGLSREPCGIRGTAGTENGTGR